MTQQSPGSASTCLKYEAVNFSIDARLQSEKRYAFLIRFRYV